MRIWYINICRKHFLYNLQLISNHPYLKKIALALQIKEGGEDKWRYEKSLITTVWCNGIRQTWSHYEGFFRFFQINYESSRFKARGGR